MSIINIPQVFKDDDTVYHYTSSKTALLYILKSNQLRLSPRSNSIDPIENTKEFISYSGEPDNEKLRRIGKKISNELNNVKQVSFCKNEPDDNSKGIVSVPPLEKYGFAKPRMWDNYGDKYTGVCIAFSRRKLKEKIMVDEDIQYLTFDEFKRRHQSVEWKGTEANTYECYKKYFQDKLFYKHKDYEMESEYRICSFLNQPFDYIDNISGAIVGLVISEKGINEYLYSGVADLIPNIPFLIAKFNSTTGFGIEKYEDYKKRIDICSARNG